LDPLKPNLRGDAKLDSLPLELLRAIIEHLSMLWDISRFARTSRRTYDAFKEMVYRDMVLDPGSNRVPEATEVDPALWHAAYKANPRQNFMSFDNSAIICTKTVHLYCAPADRHGELKTQHIISEKLLLFLPVNKLHMFQ